MDPLLKRLEVLAVPGPDHELAVDHEATVREAELGEVAPQRFPVARLHVRVAAVAVDEDDGPEAVQLRLVEPALALGQAGGQLGQHRRNGRLEHGRRLYPLRPG